MITAIVGHRGSGKSAFLERLKELTSSVDDGFRFVDLDTAIASAAGRPITELFPAIGEQAFRQLERDTLAEIVAGLSPQQSTFISLGAGFEGDIPQGARVLWVQRVTDSHGRVFMDRPSLEPQMSPLDEYLSRYEARQQRFLAVADDTYIVPEGCNRPTEADRLVAGLGPGELEGWLTILPSDVRRAEWGTFVERRLAWGVARLEVRDDLVGSEWRPHLEAIPSERLTLSYRTGERWLDDLVGSEVLRDWALELGDVPPDMDIVSLHEREGSMQDAVARISSHGPRHLKLAVYVDDFDELAEGHSWRMDDPANRSFLPRSRDGRWAWYRRIARDMVVNFFREGAGSANDQPTMAEWLMTPPGAETFAAVLGDPVAHSRTPWEQSAYFAERRMPVVAIAMSAEELTSGTLAILGDMGMTHAAVTSPLKERMFELCDIVVGAAANLGAVNTVARGAEGWIGTNTDLAGFEASAARIPDGPRVVLWGGGGTRSVVQSAIPQAVPYSARRAQPISSHSDEPSPDIVVWAVGRSRQAGCQWPPQEWRPDEIIDLNYSEDSPGLEYALQVGSRYRSGLEMFEVQAAKQREFWDGR